MFACPVCHRARVGEKCQYAHSSRQVVRCEICKRTAKCVDCRAIALTVTQPKELADLPRITAENHPENR